MLIPGDVRIQVQAMPFQIGSRHGRGGITEFVNDVEGPAFLERELMGLGVGGYR